MLTNAAKPTVAVVLCTYNGEKHIEAQLQSLAIQTWPISVFAFDDCSNDKTVELLNGIKADFHLQVETNASNLGYVSNFEQGVASVLSQQFDYIALCDQDDIWEADRVAAGMQEILAHENKLGKGAKLLAHGDLRLIDSNKQELHDSFLRYRRYRIGKAKSLSLVLGQNGVMGNTVLMNRAMAEFALPFPNTLHVHDYWLAVLSELYGHRIFINKPLVNYRIHVDNASNSSDSIALGVSNSNKRPSFRERFLHRDQELPFKEDTRLDSINFIIDNKDRFDTPSPKELRVLSTFKHYLQLNKPRLNLFASMLRHGFFRSGFKHRFKILYRMLVTNRYQ